jgi:hypothetical protein
LYQSGGTPSSAHAVHEHCVQTITLWIDAVFSTTTTFF